jgi:predicted negative regulator of RcsB-dependent stress response
MTRHPTARRVHRQESAPDDVFVAGVLETTAWAQKHRRTLIIGGIIAVILVVGTVLFVKSRADRRDQAALQLSQVRAVALSGNTQLATRELEQFVERFGSTPSGAEARLLLGRAYVEGGQHAQAIEAVQPISRDLDSDAGVNAAMLQAIAHELAGSPQDAERIYLRVGDNARFLYQRQDALENAARLRLQREDFAGAAQLYDRLVDMTPENTGERQILEMRAGEAHTLARAGGQPAAAQPAGN